MTPALLDAACFENISMKAKPEVSIWRVQAAAALITVVSVLAVPRALDRQLFFLQPLEATLLGLGGRLNALSRDKPVEQTAANPQQARPEGRSAWCRPAPPPLVLPKAADWASLELESHLNLTSAEAVAVMYQQLLEPLLHHNGLAWLGPQLEASFCGLCSARPDAQVALVGNGPISGQQREAISRASCIIRFNQMDNRLPHEATDIWITRGSKAGRVPWFVPKAINDTAPEAVVEVGRQVQGVVLADFFQHSSWHPNWSMDPHPVLLDRWPWSQSVLAFAEYLGAGAPQPAGSQLLLPLELDGFHRIWYALLVRLGYTSYYLPSTGFLGFLAVLGNLPEGGTLDVYGFNWSPENWEGHRMGLERGFMRIAGLASQGRVRMHETPCGALRTCV